MIYRDQFGLATEIEPATEKGQVAICTPPSGGKIELHAPADDSSKMGRFLRDGGSGLFAIVHESDDPVATAAAISGQGVAVERVGDDLWDIDPAATYGARLRIRSTSR